MVVIDYCQLDWPAAACHNHQRSIHYVWYFIIAASERHREENKKNDVAMAKRVYYILLFLSLYIHSRDRITRAIFTSLFFKKKDFFGRVFALDEKDNRSSSVVVSFFRQSQKTIVGAGETANNKHNQQREREREKEKKRCCCWSRFFFSFGIFLQWMIETSWNIENDISSFFILLTLIFLY